MNNETVVPNQRFIPILTNHLPKGSIGATNSQLLGFEHFFERRVLPTLPDLGYKAEESSEQRVVQVARRITGIDSDNGVVTEIRFLKIKPALKASFLNYFGIGYAAAMIFASGNPTAVPGLFLGVLGVLLNLHRHREVLSRNDPATEKLLQVFLAIGQCILKKGRREPIAKTDEIEAFVSNAMDPSSVLAVLNDLKNRGLIAFDLALGGYHYSSASPEDIRSYVSEVYGPEVKPEALDPDNQITTR